MKTSFIGSIHQVTAAQWNGLCADSYPFLRHEFLAALEDSGSTSAATGWQPSHLLVHDAGELVAAMPLYEKNHSYGEYVFDWSWADAWERTGRAYYPKLLSAVPFTPATGPRLLTQASTATLLPGITAAIKAEAQKRGASSWHCLFPPAQDCHSLAELGISRRLGCQFHWFNQGFSGFEDFLATFTSRKRKAVKKERRRVAEQGIELTVKTGAQVSAEEWQIFYQLYHLTYFKRSGRQGYLGEDFFLRLAESMPESLVMVIAYHQGEMIAAALNLRDDDTLYGRYWGCRKEFDFLHFEACYYRGIDYAIAEGLQRFDPGAQGEHKIQRGFTPVSTWSNHWIADPQLRVAVEDFLQREAVGINAYMADASRYLPFKEA